jgi:hypothetical protein
MGLAVGSRNECGMNSWAMCVATLTQPALHHHATGEDRAVTSLARESVNALRQIGPALKLGETL